MMVFVPCDSAARSVGANEVADAIAGEAARRGIDVQLVRNGSRGLFWLEPLVEVATPAGRVAYGPVTPEDVPGLFNAGMLSGGAHRLSLGLTDEIPYLARQQRITFGRCGLGVPLSLAEYVARDGFAGLEKALALEPSAIVEAVTATLLARRAGAAVRRERRILFDGVRTEVHPYDVTVERPGAAEAHDCKWGARGINADVLHQLDDARAHAAEEGERLAVGLVVFDAARSCRVRLAAQTAPTAGIGLVTLETLDRLARDPAT